eukprot:363761-Chlamydomonas_euryale.AAC.6
MYTPGCCVAAAAAAAAASTSSCRRRMRSAARRPGTCRHCRCGADASYGRVSRNQPITCGRARTRASAFNYTHERKAWRASRDLPSHSRVGPNTHLA